MRIKGSTYQHRRYSDAHGTRLQTDQLDKAPRHIQCTTELTCVVGDDVSTWVRSSLAIARTMDAVVRFELTRDTGLTPIGATVADSAVFTLASASQRNVWSKQLTAWTAEEQSA